MATTRGKERLTDQLFASKARYFNANEVKMIAVVFMKISSSDVANITNDAHGDSEKVARDLLRLWRNRTEPTVQDFADILYAAKIKKKVAIKQILGVMPNDSVKFFNQQNEKSELDEWELGYLALELGSPAIQTLAERNPGKGFPKAQVDNAKFDHADSWNFAFNTLVQWNNRTENSREVLWRLLHENEDKNIKIEDSCSKLIFGSLQNNSKKTGDISRDLPDPWLKRANFGDKDMPDSAEETYPRDSPNYLLMFNNEKFRKSNTRHGTERDAERIRNVFEKHNFIVIEEKDVSSKLLVAEVKAFSRKDSLNDQQELFLERSDLDEEGVKALEEERNKNKIGFDKKYNFFTKEERNEFETNFKNLGMKAYARNFKRDEQEIKRLTFDLNVMGKEEFAKQHKFHDEEMKEFMKAVHDNFHTLGRGAFADRCKLNSDDMEKLKKFIEKISELKDRNTKEHISLSETSCFVFVVLTHGENGQVCGGYDTQTDQLTPAKKRRVACDYRKVNQQPTPHYADMITGYSTTAGFVSTRNCGYGTTFVQNACDVLEEFWDTKDVLAMSTVINRRVAEKEHELSDGKVIVQVSEFPHTLRKTWMLPQ